MSSDVATALGAAFVASILTITGSLLVARYQAKRTAEQERLRREHEQEQARVADKRALRDAKRERLRGDYVAVGWAAQTIRDAANALAILFAGETEEDRATRLNERLDEATEDLGRAIIRLRLETGTESLLSAYAQLRAKWFEYQYYTEQAKGTHDHKEAAAALQVIEASVVGIINMAKGELDALDKPI